MSRLLRDLLAPELQSRFTVFLVAAAGYGVLQGLAACVLVPIAAVLSAGDPGAAWIWLGVLGVLAVATAVAHYVQAMQGFEVALGMIASMHEQIGSRLMRAPLGWFDTAEASTGEISHVAAKGTRAAAVMPAHLLTPVIVGVSAPATIALTMLLLDWRLGLALLLSVPLVLLVARLLSRLAVRTEAERHRAVVAVDDRVLEFARAQPALRAAGRSQDPGGYAPLRRALTEQDAVQRRSLQRSGLASGLNGALVQTVLTALVVLVAMLLLGGTVTGLEALALLVVASRFTGPLTDVADYGGELRNAQAELRRIQRVLDVEPLPEPTPASPSSAMPDAAPSPGAVELRKVRFGYEPGTRVLDGISFTARPGTMTAIVGPSGSGKTTISRLIARFWDVDDGAVLVGGRDVRDQTTEALMAQVSMVFQDVYVFDDTLRANIRAGAPDADDARLEQAAALAGVTEIVDRLPGGWETRVGEGGAALSGGEKQRVSIARALAKRAPVVLLDEATSVLDAENQRHVQAAVDSLRGTSTVLVIAHRLETVRSADQIIVLDAQGRLAQRGTHEELIAEPEGAYARFWRRRSEAQGWRLPVGASRGRGGTDQGSEGTG